MLPKGSGDQVSDDAIDQRAGPDMVDGMSLSIVSPDQPSAQTAEYPDDCQCDAGAILAIPEEEDKQGEKGERISQ